MGHGAWRATANATIPKIHAACAIWVARSESHALIALSLSHSLSLSLSLVMSGTLFEMEDPLKQQQQQHLAKDAEQQLAVCLASLELGTAAQVEQMTVLTTSTSTMTTALSNCDGSDSGLDVPSSCCLSRVTLQRGLSSTSGGYTSSNGLEEIYDSCELQLSMGVVSPSEQSSECSQKTPPRRCNGGGVKKKVAMFEPESPAKQQQQQEQLRGRVANLKRAASLPRNGAPAGTPATPTAAREKPRISSSSSFRVPNTAATPTRTPRPQKPDTLPSALNRAQSVQRLAQVQRTPSLSRARTPGTPSDDGARWPVNRGAGAARRGMSVTPDVMANRMRGSPAPGKHSMHSIRFDLQPTNDPFLFQVAPYHVAASSSLWRI